MQRGWIVERTVVGLQIHVEVGKVVFVADRSDFVLDMAGWNRVAVVEDSLAVLDGAVEILVVIVERVRGAAVLGVGEAGCGRARAVSLSPKTRPHDVRSHCS